ncbi:MAG: flagellar motor switch protein FliM [Anaerovoracaceae bacterium]|jgi:flagellar motor switch protein FliM
MSEILSQSQIDNLLDSLIGGGNAEIENTEDTIDKKIKKYDFRSPKLFTREQLKLLFSMYENYARILSSHITGVLQNYTHLEIVSIEEQQYYEFNNALPDSVLMGLIDFNINDDDENMVIMDFSKEIGFCVIDRLLGGVGKPLANDREYTEIEIGILEYFIKSIVHLMKNIWSDYIELTPKLTKIETNSRILQGISTEENVVIIVMDILMNETQGKINICIPADTLNILFKKKAAQTKKNIRKTDQMTEAQRRADILNSISETKLEIKGVLGSMDVLSHELVNLEVGDVIKLHKPVNSLVDVMIGDTTWFRGEVGCLNKKKAIAIKETLKKGSDPVKCLI